MQLQHRTPAARRGSRSLPVPCRLRSMCLLRLLLPWFPQSRSRSSRPDRRKSPGSRNASDPAGLPLQRGSLARNRCLRPPEAHWRRIDWCRSSGRPGCNDNSPPCRSMDRCCNRGDRSGDSIPADVRALNTVADNGTARCALDAEARLHAAVPLAVPDPGAGGTG